MVQQAGEGKMQAKKIISFVAGVLFLFAGFSEVVPEELIETKTISFTKNVVVKKYKKGEVHAEPYTVQKEDTLWKILVDGYGIKDKQFYFFCRITKSLNPELKDADQLVPDQVVLIPFKYITHFNIPEEQMRSVIRSVLSTQSSQVPTEDHTISKGEHLAQVLRDMYNIPDDLIFNQYLKVVKKLNPGLKDLNLVLPKQKIVLPSISAFQLSPRAEATPEEGIREAFAEAGDSPRERVVSEKTTMSLPPQAEDEREEVPGEKKGEPVFVDPPFKKIAGNVPRSRKRYIETMTSLADIFQGELHRLGDISIPLMEESHITIDTNTFPILQLTSDKRIILDYGGDLPPGIVDLVQLDPGNYEVVKLNEHENMKSVLSKVIDAAGYYAVDKTGNPLLVGDAVQFEISGDWVIYGDEFIEDVKVVNVIEKGDAPLDPQLKDSIHTHGIDMVDVYMTGEGEDPDTVTVPQAHEVRTPPAEVPVLAISNGPVLLDSLLGLLGQQYTKDNEIKLFRGASEGFDVEIMADRYFERGGVRHIVNFQPLSEKLTDLITGQGDRIFILSENVSDPLEIIEDLLQFLRLNYDAPRPGFFDRSGGKKRVGFFIPGILVERDTIEDILLTAATIKTDVLHWLVNHEVKVVQLGDAG
jgi:LysM repeat protein